MVLGLLALAAALPSVHAADVASPGETSAADDDSKNDDLQQRLTEREDKRRPIDPWSIDLAGRPLTIGGEYEIESEYRRDHGRGDALRRPDRGLLAQGFELEAFYSFGPPLSLFAQVRLGVVEDLLASSVEEMSDRYLERGEMWLYSENIIGSGINLDLGRLDFEDDRRWWWDEQLDAVRITHEGDDYEIALALARELGPRRADRDHVDPEHERVRRLIAEASWDWRPNHALQLFALHQDDRSASGIPGQQVPVAREDASDARLSWFGTRLTGGFDLGRSGILGYWFDWARVRGSERVIQYEAVDARYIEVVGIDRRQVRGSGFDLGINWLLPFSAEPRLFAGYAFGSGDGDPEAGIDRAFRQTGLHANEAGFGGVERYPHYGFLLDPELSNLHIQTIGAGLSLLRASSLDLVYHRYRLDKPATELRATSPDITLDGERRALGSGIDLVLAVEEWERFEFGFIASAFRAGRAFQTNQGAWSYGGLLALRFAF